MVAQVSCSDVQLAALGYKSSQKLAHFIYPHTTFLILSENGSLDNPGSTLSHYVVNCHSNLPICAKLRSSFIHYCYNFDLKLLNIMVETFAED